MYKVLEYDLRRYNFAQDLIGLLTAAEIVVMNGGGLNLSKQALMKEGFRV